MAEKLLIIAEKDTAANNFQKALGGTSGIFDGNEYAIISLSGHVIENPVPDEVALPDYKQVVGKFSQLEGIPWSPSWFDFNKKVPKNPKGNRIVRDIGSYLKQGYIPVIASDIDESGEGDLLAWEVLIYLNYKGKVYREYHLDETPKPFLKSLRDKKEITQDDPIFKMAFARSNMDYLTQQLTRVATMGIQAQGYRLPAPVPMGRLKSVMLVILGDQKKALDAYTPSSEFESRYQLDKLILKRTDMTRFKTKDEWNAEGLPFESRVKEVRQVPGKTIPPKAFTLSKLAGAMSKKGMKVKQFQETYQKMYEAGVVSYPRTDDNFVSPEQFQEVLPHVDTVLDLLSLPSAAFTRREPRSTHVKTGGAHGALRFGENIPKSLNTLDQTYGKFASDIYRLLSERFLMMFLEDTEWVRHEYETIDTEKPFKGSVKIITKQGVVDPDEDKDDTSIELPNLGKKAELYPHEVKSVKPAAPTTDWLMNQLEKVDVGTGATRVSTLSNISGNKDTYPIKESKLLDLSPIGWVGYQSAQGTTIGSVEGTQYLTQLAKEVKDGKDITDAYDAITQVIASDVEVLRNKSIDLDGLGIQKSKPKAEGTWKGKQIKFNKQYMDHVFTDEEVAQLLAGQEITIPVTGNDKKQTSVKGKLADLEYNGHPFVGFKGQFIKEGYVTGIWNGKEVTIKGSFMDYTFTDEEVKTLFDGGIVEVVAHKGDQTYNVTGQLAEQSYKGRSFIGYKAEFPKKEGYVEGVWKGKKVAFKGSFMGHTFTDGELKALLSGGSITFKGTKKAGGTTDVSGKLENKKYKGKSFVGFEPDW